MLRIAGLRIFLEQLRKHVYSRATYIGLERDLSVPDSPVQCAIKYTLCLATAEDMDEILQKAKTESKESARELLRRRRFYERGFHNCYVARTADSGELCYMEWVITAKDNDLIGHNLSPLPIMKPDEFMVENSFTFEKYRKCHVQTAVRHDLTEMMKKQGFKRGIGYVDQNKTAYVKSLLIDGRRPFEEVNELRLFFRARSRRKKISPSVQERTP
jgi:hypothetical protein